MATYAIDYELVDRKGKALRIVRMPYGRMASVGTVLGECTIPSCRQYARSMVYGRMATYAIDYELVDCKGKALRIVRMPYGRMASVGTVLGECTIPSCRQYARSMVYGRMATYAIDYELVDRKGKALRIVRMPYGRMASVGTVLGECTIPSCRQYARSMVYGRMATYAIDYELVDGIRCHSTIDHTACVPPARRGRAFAKDRSYARHTTIRRAYDTERLPSTTNERATTGIPYHAVGGYHRTLACVP